MLKIKDDGDWVKQCMSMEIAGTRRRGSPRRTWCDFVKDVMRSFGLSCEDAQDKDKSKEGILLTQVTWKMTVKMVCT